MEESISLPEMLPVLYLVIIGALCMSALSISTSNVLGTLKTSLLILFSTYFIATLIGIVLLMLKKYTAAIVIFFIIGITSIPVGFILIWTAFKLYQQTKNPEKIEKSK